MKFLFITAGLLCTTIALPTYAYRIEVEGGMNNSAIDSESDGNERTQDGSSLNLKGTIYLKNVDTHKGPLAEAAFLSKAGFVNGEWTKGSESEEGVLSDYDNKDGSLNIQLNTERMIFSFSHKDSQTKNAYRSFDALTTKAGVGFYMSDRSTILFSVINRTGKFNGRSIEKSRGFSTRLKLHTPIGGKKSLSVGGGAALYDTELEEGIIDAATFGFDVFATLYLNRQLGLTLDLNTDSLYGEYGGSNDAYSNIDTTTSFKIEYFANEQVALFGQVGLLVGETDNEDRWSTTTDRSGSSVDIGIKGRF